jgi:hypothetical protein
MSVVVDVSAYSASVLRFFTQKMEALCSKRRRCCQTTTQCCRTWPRIVVGFRAVWQHGPCVKEYSRADVYPRKEEEEVGYGTRCWDSSDCGEVWFAYESVCGSNDLQILTRVLPFTRCTNIYLPTHQTFLGNGCQRLPTLLQLPHFHLLCIEQCDIV